MPAVSTRRWRLSLFGLFALSGFSGLIYESVWSNYLKLFLGHGAYAQALVLAMFMGGMAIGAWASGPLLKRIARPLLGYAAIEALIGLLGLVFHAVFLRTTGFMLDEVLPGMTSPVAIAAVRWGLGALLLLPQAILLGATFPLMTAGVLRAFPALPGRSISLLYFNNSVGAVFGVLCSGFWLIDRMGLPGTILTAALINVALALLVYIIDDRLRAAARRAPVYAAPPRPHVAPAALPAGPRLPQLLLGVALVTGLSSFVYEVAWIRMLSLVLGASTHAFELMLSAFILGLALGGLWIRARIDRFARPVAVLAWVQLLMGGLALGTVVGYNQLFELMSAVMSALQKNDAGYAWFNLSSHGVALLVMLPVTFMAGMTLPLITYVLYERGGGETAIGRVYAFNTLGAIVGVALTALLLLPQFGLRPSIIVGAALDIGLGLLLLRGGGVHLAWRLPAWAIGIAAIALVGLHTEFDFVRMSSGVFRTGQLKIAPGKITDVMHRDGRTASVAVYELESGKRVISTNGKPDASVQMTPDDPPAADEPTMVLTGGLPFLVKPDIRTAAVIGIGSGISANVMLASPTLRSLDVIEIEAAMIEGARHFGVHSQRVFEDPRAEIHIDDAKSYFATHRKRYDLIVSEPSNPWVSGVAGLFSQEFYARVKKHINEGGLLIQWLQTYESDMTVVASIVKALSSEFADYRIYAANDTDLVIVASPSAPLTPLVPDLFTRSAAFRQDFARVGWNRLDDVRIHELGARRELEALFALNPAPANSDFFPYVDQHAVRARYKGRMVEALALLAHAQVPLPGDRFDGSLQVSADAPVIAFAPATAAQHAQQIAQYYAAAGKAQIPPLRSKMPESMLLLDRPPACRSAIDHAIWQAHLVTLAGATIPHLTGTQLQPMFESLRGKLCDADGDAAASRALLELLAALGRRDMPGVEMRAKAWLGDRAIDATTVDRYVLEALLLALDMQDKPLEALVAAGRGRGKLSAASELFLARARHQISLKSRFNLADSR